MSIRAFGRALCAAAALLLLAQPAQAVDPLPADAKIAADPTVKTGILSNGLRYAIRRNGTPPGALSIRLAMHVGSYNETDYELGFAHYVEHMAFRSTKQAPEGSLDTRFASMGVAFGRDLNATTGLDATIYQMNLPAGGLKNAKIVLEWLRGAADGILFTPTAVEVERGVVLAEIRSRTSPATLMMNATTHFQAPELRSLHRDPGGTEESLKAATAAGLQAFYDRWYRPENATLVIVGDAPEEELVKIAEESFGSWRARGPAGALPAPDKLKARGLDALTMSHPSLPAVVSACRGSPLDGARDGSLEQLRTETLSLLWTTILATRLNDSSGKPGSPLLGAGPMVNHGLPEARFACLIAVPTDGKWREGLAAAQAELRRFGTAGPTQRELEGAIDTIRGRLRSVQSTAATRTSSALADQIAEAETAQRPFGDPTESLRIFDLLVSGVTPEDVKKTFESEWSGTGPLLALNSAEPVAKEALTAAWTANEAADQLEAYSDTEAAVWAYPFAKRGKVASRELFPEDGFTRLTFKNGVVLNFKRTPFESDAVEVRIRFGHGERGMRQDERLPTALAAGFFPLGGLGKMDFKQISSVLGEGNWEFKLEPQATGYVLSSSMLREAVPQQLPLLAAFMIDPGFRKVIDEKLPTATDLIYRAYKAEPMAVAQEALDHALFPGQPTLPPREELARYKAADFERILKPVLTRSPIEVTIVGDIDEEEATRAVAYTFGALPRRPRLAAAAGEGPFRRFPATLPPPATGLHEGSGDKAAALMMWPLYIASPERRREEYAIGLLRSIFEMRLLHEVRVVMGKVYSPSVTNMMIDEADQGYISASIEATPADIDSLVAATRKLAGELAGGAITQEEVDAARQPLMASNDQALRQNGPWAAVLSHSVRNPDALFELTRLRADLEALTLEDVRKAAATWLAATPVIARALPRAASDPGSPQGAPAVLR